MVVGNLYETVLRQVVLVSRVFGLAPVSASLHVLRWHHLYSLTYVLVTIIVQTYHLTHLDEFYAVNAPRHRVPTVSEIIRSGFISAHFVSNVITFVGTWCNARHISNCLRSLTALDKDLRHAAIACHYTLFRAAFYYMFLNVVFYFGMVYWMSWSNPHEGVQFWRRLAPTLVRGASDASYMQIVLFLLYMAYVAARISQHLRRSRADTSADFIAVTSACLLHARLVHVYYQFVKGFGIQIFAYATLRIILILVSVHHSFLIKAQFSVGLPRLIIVNGLPLFMILLTCTLATIQTNKIGRTLMGVKDTFKDSELKRQVESYGLKMRTQKIRFSAIGFYDLTFAMFYAVIIAVANLYFVLVDLSSQDDD